MAIFNSKLLNFQRVYGFTSIWTTGRANHCNHGSNGILHTSLQKYQMFLDAQQVVDTLANRPILSLQVVLGRAPQKRQKRSPATPRLHLPWARKLLSFLGLRGYGVFSKNPGPKWGTFHCYPWLAVNIMTKLHLVGGFNQPLWKMMEWKSVGMIIPFPIDGKNKIQAIHVPVTTNQIIYI